MSVLRLAGKILDAVNIIVCVAFSALLLVALVFL